MLTRLASGMVFVALLLAAALLGGAWWSGLVALMALIGVQEAYGMEQGAGRRPARIIGYVLAPGLSLIVARSTTTEGVAAAIVLATVASFLWQLRQAPCERSTVDWMSTLVHPIYLGLLLGFLAGLRQQGGSEAGLAWLLLLMAMIWANDSGAYLGGRWLGRRSLAPSVSPKKTWEGAIAGSLACLLVALVLPALAGSLSVLAPLAVLPLWLRLALGIGISLLGPVGDLSESVLKRQAGVKDSGRLIPGHGGILDRIDSLIFCAPLVYLAARWLAG
jgi:phosphatidate cytidylyltransferase